MRGYARGEEVHAIEGERFAGALRGAKVAEVDRVEGPPHEADLQVRSTVSGSGLAATSLAEERPLQLRQAAPVTADTGTTARPRAAPSRRRSGSGSACASTRVALRRGHELGPLEEGGVPATHLLADEAQVGNGIATARAGGIDHVQEHAGALDVPQELQAEAGAGVGAFDDPRDVRGHEALVVHLDHTQDGAERW